MKLLLASPGIGTRERHQAEYELNKAIRRIERQLGRMSPRLPILRARLTSTGSTERPLFTLTLSIHLADHPVVVQKSGDEVRALVAQCDVALRKEMQRSAARIRKEHLRKRKRARQAAFTRFSREVAIAPPELPASKVPVEPESNPLFARLRPLLSSLYNHAREMIRMAQMAGELPANYLSPEDLVDQAVLSALEGKMETLKDPRKLELKLFQSIDRALAREIRTQHPGGQEFLSLEAPAPEEEERWHMGGGPGAEEMEFYQPFEALRLEDVLIDHSAGDPAHRLSDVEQHRVILKHLTQLPSKSRSAFFLNRVEGFDTYEIAMMQGRAEDVVERDIERCVEVLQDGWPGHRAENNGAGKSKKAAARR